MTIRLSPDPEDAPASGNPPSPEPAPPPPPPEPAPRAAAVVANAEVTEESLRLRQELSAREAELKDRERTICEMQDSHEAYRRAVETPKPVPVRRSPRTEEKPFRLGRFNLE